MQPYCNVVTLTITQIPGGYTLAGHDDQCGAAKVAGAGGVAHINPDGTVGLEFSIVAAPSARTVHVSASLNPVTGSGFWYDSSDNTGTLALGAPGTGSPRPLPTSGLRPGSVTNVELAARAVRAGNFGATFARTSQITVAPGFTASAHANCLPGEQVLSGGNEGGPDMPVTTSRLNGNGWIVYVQNQGSVSRVLTVYAYCLAP